MMITMNGYIVDTFLAFWTFLTLYLLIFQLFDLIARLNERVDSHSFVHYFSQKFKLSLYVSVIPIIIFVFLLWRFAELLVLAKMWGAGAVGLIVIMGLAGVVMIWLSTIIQLILQSAEQLPKPQPPNMGTYNDYNG